MVFRVVDENSHFLGTNLSSTVAKDKQHGINDIRLATAVRTNYGAETLCVLCVCVCVSVYYEGTYSQIHLNLYNLCMPYPN